MTVNDEFEDEDVGEVEMFKIVIYMFGVEMSWWGDFPQTLQT